MRADGDDEAKEEEIFYDFVFRVKVLKLPNGNNKITFYFIFYTLAGKNIAQRQRREKSYAMEFMTYEKEKFLL